MFNVQLIVSALFPLSNIIGIMAFEPIFTFDNSLGMLYDEDYGGNRKKIAIGSSAPSKRNNPLFTASLPLLSEDDEMKTKNMSTPPKTAGYIPPYRSYQMEFETSEDQMLMSSDGATSDATQQFCANGQGLFENERSRSYHVGAFSPYSGASPVPSIISSEYSVSPYPFEAPSPLPSDGKSNAMHTHYDSTEGFGTPMQGTVHTPFSPSSSQYYFTPVKIDEDDCIKSSKSPENFPGFQSKKLHAALPQCRPVSTDAASLTRQFTPISKQYAEAKRESGRNVPLSTLPQYAEAESRRESSLKVPLSTLGRATIPSNRSYLSTAMRGNQLSQTGTFLTPSYRRNSLDASSNPKSSPCARSPIVPSVSSPNASLPQNLKGDPHRQAKVKTELCLNFSRGLECKFGTRCNYAHGEHELKYTKLFELKKSGLVADIDAYRAYPCFSWVSTGACPFGLRCNHLHDPRVVGSESSWLPHCDVPLSSIQTDLIVDKSHHHILRELSQTNPLVQNLLWDYRPSLMKNPDAIATNEMEESEWRDTYSLVCNLANLNPTNKLKPSTFSKVKISELQRLCIAVQMACGSEPTTSSFVYKPKHLVYNELCMVLRTKYFRFLTPDNLSGSVDITDVPRIESIVSEITLEEFQAVASFWNRDQSDSNKEVVVVHELAFGCAGEPASRTSLWFDLHYLKELSPQEIKRLKRNKQRINASANNDVIQEIMPYPGSERTVTNFHRDRPSSSRARTPSSFDTHPHKPFYCMEPSMNIAVTRQLIKDMLYHRIAVLFQREYRLYAGSDAEVRAFITVKDFELRKSFQNIKKALTKSKWPVAKGRETISADTSVPKCSSEYIPSKSSQVTSIWEEFLSSSNANFNEERLEKDPEQNKARLPMFCQLAMNKSVNKFGSAMPHIKQGSNDETSDDSWESILLDKNDGWKMIKNHYLGSKGLSKDKCMPLSPANGDRIASTIVL